jgi:hypothetical protein
MRGCGRRGGDRYLGRIQEARRDFTDDTIDAELVR